LIKGELAADRSAQTKPPTIPAEPRDFLAPMVEDEWYGLAPELHSMGLLDRRARCCVRGVLPERSQLAAIGRSAGRDG